MQRKCHIRCRYSVVLATSLLCATRELNYWCITAHMAIREMITNSPPSGAYLTNEACLSSKFHHVVLKDAVAARLAARLAAPVLPWQTRLSRSKSWRTEISSQRQEALHCRRVCLYNVVDRYVLSSFALLEVMWQRAFEFEQKWHLCVCERNNSKSFKWILMIFFWAK